MQTRKTHSLPGKYLRAHQRAYAWAEVAIAHSFADDVTRTDSALRKVAAWLIKIRELETSATRQFAEANH